MLRSPRGGGFGPGMGLSMVQPHPMGVPLQEEPPPPRSMRAGLCPSCKGSKLGPIDTEGQRGPCKRCGGTGRNE
jgi:hypothetical protein